MAPRHSNLLFPLGFPTTPASPFPPVAPDPQFSYSEIDTRALCEDTPATVGRPRELGNPARRITYGAGHLVTATSRHPISTENSTSHNPLVNNLI